MSESIPESILIECFKEMSDENTIITHEYNVLCDYPNFYGEYEVDRIVLGVYCKYSQKTYDIIILPYESSMGNNVFACYLDDSEGNTVSYRHIKLRSWVPLISRPKVKYKISKFLEPITEHGSNSEIILSNRLIHDTILKSVQSYEMDRFRYIARGSFLLFYPKHCVYASSLEDAISHIEITMFEPKNGIFIFKCTTNKASRQISVSVSKEELEQSKLELSDYIIESIKPILN